MRKLIAFACVLWAMPLIVNNLTDSIYLGGEVQAADEKKKKKTRKVPAMREQTYKRLAEAQLMIDPDSAPREEGEPAPEPKGTPQDAVVLLLKLNERRGLNSYEHAQVWNTLAFAYYTLEDTPNTIKAYEMVLAQGTITEALEQSVVRALFQLFYSQENFAKSIRYIERWEAIRDTPDAGVTFIKSTAYYHMDDFDNALKFALRVEEIALEQQRTIKERWWYLQVVLYNELTDYEKVVSVLEKLIINYPKKQYWMHLAGMYGEMNEEGKALSAYYAAYTQDMFTKETEIVMLSQRLLNAEVPFEAASVLEKGFKEGIIEENEKNLKLLATAYTMSQDMSKAIDAWRDATKFTDEGDLHYRLAQALANEDRHKEAVKSYEDAIDVGDLKDAGDVNFWYGISLMQLENWDKATSAFRAASKRDKKMKKQAGQYIRYIKGEKRRQEELRKMLES
ncbi:MAG: hypothetical protein VB957_15685 [Pseudomonadales bacterium]